MTPASSPTKRHILLTGVSKGLGRAMAVELAALGHTLDGCSRSQGALDALAGELGDGHHFQAVDVADVAQVDAWAQSVLAAGRVPDLILNNAALINRPAPLWELSADEFSQLIDVNIKGVVHIIQAFVPAMVQQQRGVIINFSSGWGQITAPNVAPYCASKFAIEGMTQAMAQELPDGMAAIPLSPGIIHTDMLDVAFGDGAAAYPNPDAWVKDAVPYILGLGPDHNGQSLRVPGH